MSNQQFKPSIIYPIIVAIVLLILCGSIFFNIGLAPVVIIGGSAVIAYFVWLFTTYKKPADPQKILPVFLLALALQIIHTIEEYIADFAGELSVLFNLNPVGRDFFAVAIMGGFASVWVLTAFGLIYRNPLANFMLWFFVIGPGLVNGLAHVVLAIIANDIYFPGLITVVLPTVASIAVLKVLISRNQTENT